MKYEYQSPIGNRTGTGKLKLTRENDDQKYYGDIEAKGESLLLHHLKQLLNANGFDLIKKRMWKDGHMVDVYQQYLRGTDPDGVMVGIYNPNDAIAGLNDYWNENGTCTLFVADLLPREG